MFLTCTIRSALIEREHRTHLIPTDYENFHDNSRLKIEIEIILEVQGGLETEIC